jgi:hypothetical protein
MMVTMTLVTRARDSPATKATTIAVLFFGGDGG